MHMGVEATFSHIGEKYISMDLIYALEKEP
jgi:hypothetical protein